MDSPNCKKSKPQALENAESMDKIAFRDVEGFMKAEKIKYYRDDEESKSVVSEPKKSESIGNFIRGRGATGNAGNPLGRDENGGNRIGVDRKLIAYIPGTMGRGGNPPVNKCSATGSISISYSVDKDGNVVSAKRSGGVLDACIISTSISWVKEFVKAEKANVYSSGIYKITF